jgi:hypothetical protein
VLKGSIARTVHVSILSSSIEGPRGVLIQVLGGAHSGPKGGAHSPQNVPVLATDGVRC